MLDTVFDLFVQSHRTLDRAAGGLGLGLTLVRSLVAMHDGTVTAHSDGEGQGSEFVVRLPLADEPTEEVAAEAPRRPRARIPRAAKVVIVEDNADSRELLCEILGHAGFDCRAAPDGPSGLALVEAFAPDIAIVDVGLPVMDGFELARRIRRNPRLTGTRLVALTGYGQPADRATAHEAGFDEHVVKPVHPDELVRMLDEMRGPDPASDG
jgi:two-component system CheB/CheR fusion protein